MTHQEAIEMFPVAIKVTKLMIERANIVDSKKCIGAKTLRKVFNSRTVEWGVTSGHFFVDGNRVCVYAINDNGDSLDMMCIEKPTTVILTVIQPARFSFIEGINSPKLYKE